MKEIPNEDPSEREIRKQVVLNEFEAVIQKLKLHAERHKSNYENVDEIMADFLQTKFSGDLLGELENLWREETTYEEKRSQIKGQSRKEWLEKYEHEFDNEDLIKPRKQTKRKNSSPRRQHNTNHNGRGQVRDKRHHTPARNQGSTARTTKITEAPSSETKPHTTTSHNREKNTKAII